MSTLTSRQAGTDEAGAARPGNYRSLDAWRGIAALLVVLFHNSDHLAARYPLSRNTVLGQVSARGYLGVELFYVISGFCIANAMVVQLSRSEGLLAAMRAFTRARLRRIYPTYWAALFFMLLVGLFLSQFGGVSQALADEAKTGVARNAAILDWRSVLESITLTSGAFGHVGFLPVSWTLCYEVAFYGIVLAFAVLFARRSPNNFLTALHMLTLASVAGLLFCPARLCYPVDMWPIFGLGVLVYDGVRRPVAAAPYVFFSLAVLGMVAIASDPTRQFGPHGARDVAYFSVSAATILWALHRWDPSMMRLRAVQALVWVGTFSYSLYLVGFAGAGFADLLLQPFSLAGFAYAAHFALRAACAVLAGWVFYRLCENPILRRQRARRPQLQLA